MGMYGHSLLDINRAMQTVHNSQETITRISKIQGKKPNVWEYNQINPAKINVDGPVEPDNKKTDVGLNNEDVMEQKSKHKSLELLSIKIISKLYANIFFI